MQTIIAIELFAIILLLLRRNHSTLSGQEPVQEPALPDLRAEAQQKAWNDGLSSILAYDLVKARGAVRCDDE